MEHAVVSFFYPSLALSVGYSVNEKKKKKRPVTPSAYGIIKEILTQRHKYSAKNFSHPNLMINEGFFRKYKMFFSIFQLYMHTRACAYVDAALLILDTFERLPV